MSDAMIGYAGYLRGPFVCILDMEFAVDMFVPVVLSAVVQLIFDLITPYVAKVGDESKSLMEIPNPRCLTNPSLHPDVVVCLPS